MRADDAALLATGSGCDGGRQHWLATYARAPSAVHAYGDFPPVYVMGLPQSLLVLERAPSEVDDLRAEEWV